MCGQRWSSGCTATTRSGDDEADGAGARHDRRILQPCAPTKAELEDYITGWSVNGNGGFTSEAGIGGKVGVSRSIPSGVTGIDGSITGGSPDLSWSLTGQYTVKLF
ncbi:MAG TPA: hypothetical protein VGD37_08575 [Kofleriaceae bacterium]|jgi:hypothetical protein